LWVNSWGNVIKVSVAEVEEKSDLSKTNSIKEKDEETDIVKTYNIYINVKGQDEKIAEINKEGKLIIDEENIEKIDPENRLGLRELGEEEKPDVSEINRLEGKTSEELEKEILEEEKPKEEKIDDLMEIEAQKQGISKEELKSNMIELELDTIKVTENKTLRHILGIQNNYTRVFAVPGRDATEYTIQGLTKEGTLETLDNLKQIEGTNPTQKVAVMGKDGKQIESKSTIAMFELEGKGMQEGLTIGKGQLDYKEISYYRRVDNNMYISTPVAQKNGVDRDEGTYETKRLMDRNETEHDEVKEHINTNEKLEKVKDGKIEVPNKINITIDGIQYEDITQGREMMVQKLINDSEYNYTKEEATEIVDNVLDKQMDFDKAKEEIDIQKQRTKKENDGGRDRATEALERMMYGNH